MIQLWRRVTDSSLIDECTDDILIDHRTSSNISGICFQRARSRKYKNNTVRRWKTSLLISRFLFIHIIDEKRFRTPTVICSFFLTCLFISSIVYQTRK